jgi:hypothetical protein
VAKNEIVLGAVTQESIKGKLVLEGRDGNSKYKPILIEASKMVSCDPETGETNFIRVEVKPGKDGKKDGSKLITALKLVMKREKDLSAGLKVGKMADGDVAIYRPEVAKVTPTPAVTAPTPAAK